MTLAAAVLAALAGLVHLAIFAAESLLWRRERVWRAFGARSAEQARLQEGVFFNQGFYNLFLGLGALTGAVMVGNGGSAMLAVYTCLFMTGAAIVLLSRYPAMWPAALVQGGPPALAVLALALAG